MTDWDKRKATWGFTAASKVQTWHGADLGHFRQMQVLSQGNATSKTWWYGSSQVNQSISQSLSNPHWLHLPRMERCSQRSLWEYHSAKVYPAQPPRSNVDHGPWLPHRLAWDTNQTSPTNHQSPTSKIKLVILRDEISPGNCKALPFHWVFTTSSTFRPIMSRNAKSLWGRVFVNICHTLHSIQLWWETLKNHMVLLKGFKGVMFGFNVKLSRLVCVSICAFMLWHM